MTNAKAAEIDLPHYDLSKRLDKTVKPLGDDVVTRVTLGGFILLFVDHHFFVISILGYCFFFFEIYAR